VAHDQQTGNFWIGGRKCSPQSGFTRWDRARDTWYHYEADFIDRMDSDNITDIAFDKKNVWLGTDRGLIRYQREKRTWRKYTTFDGLSYDVIYCLARDGYYLWVGTRKGLDRVTISSTATQRIGEKDFRYLTIYDIETDSTLVWLATSEGIYTYRKQAPYNQWNRVRDPDQYLDLDCRSLHLTGKKVWFGGKNYVLCFDRQNKTWLTFTPPHYFPACAIYTITSDAANVWCGTSRGVLKYSRETGKWRTLSTADGLASNYVRSIVLDGDYVWFGTRAGLTRFFWNRPHKVD
jgi:ligand-binding sensor domain-containing protein